ncbi:tetratricopeptide repeat protein [Oscillatoria sp. FACHB-1406]|uniref:tetratricopeptide repeat protein n=1 Tax=Oscillatoria sp. FACHB-1406 TaxID=2692846 RepID=UPI00168705F1|nr:tetratricopeptide repeat protein [Oscillatoria sp. FACHB-1406]MBD2576330.1 tetratricopeptide repeat protein [Oscillatoria sp. FACHB-1406]
MLWLVAVFVSLGWVLSLCFHEFGHALIAYWGGDTSVKEKGYLTFNPLKYTDPGLSLVLPIFFLLLGGIALPGGAVYINQKLLRDRKWQSAVSAAGPLANILVVLFFSIPFQLGWNQVTLDRNNVLNSAILSASLAFLILINTYVVILNLLPLPSLDGYGIIEPWLPPAWQRQFRQFGQYGIWVLIALLWFVQPFNQLLWNVARAITESLGVPLETALVGGEIFRQYSFLLVGVLILGLWIFGSKEKRWYGKGNNWAGMKRYAKALDCYEKALAINANFAEAWQAKGYVLTQLQRYEEAIAAYDRAISLQPQNTSLLMARGEILQALQRQEEAIASFDRAVELQPENAEVWFYRGSLLLDLQQWENALLSFDRALALSLPRDKTAMTWYSRSYALAQLKQDKAALEACDRALKLDPNSYTYLIWRGDLLASLNRSEERLAAYNRALKFKPNLAQLWLKRGEVLRQLQRYEEAIASCARALALEPKTAEIWYEQARCYCLQGNIERAIESLKSAIAIDSRYRELAIANPDFTAARQKNSFP